MADQDTSTWDKTEDAEGFREHIGKQQSSEMPPPLSMPDEPMSLHDSDSVMDNRAFREQLSTPDTDDGQTADAEIDDTLT
jgi:hypothetical protein